MSGKSGLCGIVIATVTVHAGDRRVSLACMKEFRIIEFIALRVRRGKRKKDREKKKSGPGNCSGLNQPSQTAADTSPGRKPGVKVTKESNEPSKRAAEIL